MKQFKYVQQDKNQNKAQQYASAVLKNPITSTIHDDYSLLINNNCTYLRNFFCDTNDLTIFNNLKSTLDMNNMIQWSKHHKYENPQSQIFDDIINKMANHFNVKILQTRMNYYKDFTEFKPMHRDSHAYCKNADGTTSKENFTMGASFGHTRNLDFVHEQSGAKFTFPQHNGDVFAFTDKVNDKFLHGVPKLFKTTVPNTERISIICWGIK